jgi:hypothetical protein
MRPPPGRAARLGQHPIEHELEVAVVAIGGEKHALAVGDDHAVLDLPMGSEVTVPLGLPRRALLGRALAIERRIEVLAHERDFETLAEVVGLKLVDR